MQTLAQAQYRVDLVVWQNKEIITVAIALVIHQAFLLLGRSFLSTRDQVFATSVGRRIQGKIFLPQQIRQYLAQILGVKFPIVVKHDFMQQPFGHNALIHTTV